MGEPRQPGTGNVPDTVVPLPGADSNRNVPPTDPARRLVLVHHSPDRTDSDVACVLDEAEAERDRRAHGLEVGLGRQGDEVRVEAAKIGT